MAVWHQRSHQRRPLAQANHEGRLPYRGDDPTSWDGVPWKARVPARTPERCTAPGQESQSQLTTTPIVPEVILGGSHAILLQASQGLPIHLFVAFCLIQAAKQRQSISLKEEFHERPGENIRGLFFHTECPMGAASAPYLMLLKSELPTGPGQPNAPSPRQSWERQDCLPVRHAGRAASPSAAESGYCAAHKYGRSHATRPQCALAFSARASPIEPLFPKWPGTRAQLMRYALLT